MQAIHRDPLMRVSAIGVPTRTTQRGESDIPDDVRVLHDALARLREHKKGEPLTLDLKNCGTALRFLQVHLAQCYPGEPIQLTGDARLMERDGAPTTQTTSAMIMHGADVPAEADESPYITMTRRLMQAYPNVRLEQDWSSAAFWYEHVALHSGELLLEGLTDESLQGDRVVADIYAAHFAVQTTFTARGAIIVNKTNRQSFNRQLEIDFSNCPDLYPAIALTCERLGITLHATGTERLAYKESDRLEAVARHETRHDHRMAMALMTAGFQVDDTDCISKSYPSFLHQWIAVTSGEGGA